MTSAVVFLEDEVQSQYLLRSGGAGDGTTLVAVTAEASQFLDSVGRTHRRIGEFAKLSDLAAHYATLNIEVNRLAIRVEKGLADQVPEAAVDGPGFLSGQQYYLQYAASAVLARGFLYQKALESLRPSRVRAFQGPIDPWFASDGYLSNPWNDLLSETARNQGAILEMSPQPPNDRRLHPGRSRLRRIRRRRHIAHLVRSAPRHLARLGINGARRADAPAPPAQVPLTGRRIVLVDQLGYDWAPVIERLRGPGGPALLHLPGRPVDPRHVWTFAFDPRIEGLSGADSMDLASGPLRYDPKEGARLEAAVRPVLQEGNASLRIAGFELAAPLSRHLISLARFGPALLRHSDAVSHEFLSKVRPDAFAFFAMPYLAVKRLAHHCHLASIPLFCYQHGGGYGTNDFVQHESIEYANADHFLTYGPGIRPPARPHFPRRAQFHPVGSARAIPNPPRDPPRPTGRIRVLWVGELSTRNTIAALYQAEDTERHIRQRQGLGILAASPCLETTFRPYPGYELEDGTPLWIQRTRLPHLTWDSTTHMRRLLEKTDVVVTDTATNTVWNEVLQRRIPLILLADPVQTHMTSAFQADVEAACHWHKTADGFLDELRSLAETGHRWPGFVERKRPDAYVENYVCSGRPEDVPERVIRLLSTILAGSDLAEASTS